MNKRLASNMHG